MHRTRYWLRLFIIPALAVLGSTVTINPILGAELADDMKAIKELLQKIDTKLENQNTITMLMADRLKADLGQLRDELAQTKRELADLKNRLNSPTTSSYYGGSSTSMAPMAASSSIRLINNYLTEMTAVVNGAVYNLMPGQTTNVAIPPGFVTYQVLQTQPFAKSTTLQPGEVLTLRLFPR